MQRLEVIDLIKKYNADACSEEEKALVESWYLQFEQKELADLSDEERIADLDKIWNALPVHHQKIRQMGLWYRVAAAAIILVFLSVGVYIVSQQIDKRQQQTALNLSRSITPGGNSAILTLNNGQQIALTGAQNGQLATQGNTAVTKTADGHVAYDPKQAVAHVNSSQNLVYNTMTTPTGGTYNLTLSDGTKVSLDAASSIRYPVDFNGNERRVEITGQAYLEVAHNKLKPFRVTSNGQTVEVLGTHFNINAYTDEGSTKTTLLEGRVKVSKAGKVAFLQPGQQSVVLTGDANIDVNDADIETTMAWKTGIFRFKRADLQTVMRQFSRWYNVQVFYEGNVPDAAITGKVQRNANASHVLEILNKLGIKFKIEGRKITILQ
jgi:transmembrane sensor